MYLKVGIDTINLLQVEYTDTRSPKIIPSCCRYTSKTVYTTKAHKTNCWHDRVVCGKARILLVALNNIQNCYRNNALYNNSWLGVDPIDE